MNFTAVDAWDPSAAGSARRGLLSQHISPAVMGQSSMLNFPWLWRVSEPTLAIFEATGGAAVGRGKWETPFKKIPPIMLSSSQA